MVFPKLQLRVSKELKYLLTVVLFVEQEQLPCQQLLRTLYQHL